MSTWKRAMTTGVVVSSIVLGTSGFTSIQTQAATSAPASVYRDPLSMHSQQNDDDTTSDIGIAKDAKSAVVMDAATGKILYGRDAHEELPMASITKIMTMLLIEEAIDDGRLKWTDKVKVSEYAASMGGSQIFLEPGETMSVRDMMKGISIASANDACVAMAEYLDGSEEAFVARMNARARSLGMDDTHFSNCNGLPVANHYSSAHDIALMSRALLQHPEITTFTSIYSDYLRKDTDSPLWLVNTNKLVRFYDGVDGLKTGYTREAKYCLSATAKRDGFRVIAVVMGEPKPTVRNAEVSGMLNWAFSHYTSTHIYPKGHIIGHVNVVKGVHDTVDAITSEPVGFVATKGHKMKTEQEVSLHKVTAPVAKGTKVGELTVKADGDVVATVPLVAKEAVSRANFFQGLSKTVRKIVTFGAAD